MQLGKGGDLGVQLLVVCCVLYVLGCNGVVGNVVVCVGFELLVVLVLFLQVVVGIVVVIQLGQIVDGKQILLVICIVDLLLLLEFGCLCELIFCQVGEGIGCSCDFDNYDLQYEYIVIWDVVVQCIVGVYWIMCGVYVLVWYGLFGFYSVLLFCYFDDVIIYIVEGLELGCSFVVFDYWGSCSLDYLWQGIGVYLQCWLGICYLFGVVLISVVLLCDVCEQLVVYYQCYYSGSVGLVELNCFFQYFVVLLSFGELDVGVVFDVFKVNLVVFGIGVLMLYCQYIDLCEFGGVCFFVFGVDLDFSDLIDGLIEVDLCVVWLNKCKCYLCGVGMLV